MILKHRDLFFYLKPNDLKQIWFTYLGVVGIRVPIYKIKHVISVEAQDPSIKQYR